MTDNLETQDSQMVLQPGCTTPKLRRSPLWTDDDYIKDRSPEWATKPGEGNPDRIE